MTKNYTVIAELLPRQQIEDTDLIIVEDEDDTKQASVLDLKKNFTGDYKEPNSMNFYSSEKVSELINSLQREMSTLATSKQLDSIAKRIDSIISYSNPNKDSELVESRDGSSSLKTRLERDIEYADDRFMSKPYRTISGTQVSTDCVGYVNIYATNMTSSTANIILKSKNILDTSINKDTPVVRYNDTGFTYSPITDGTAGSIVLSLDESAPKGHYFFLASIVYDALFKDKSNIKFIISNTKDPSAYKEFNYNQSASFEFDAPKAFNTITLKYNNDKVVRNSVVQYKSVMLTRASLSNGKYMSHTTLIKPITKDKNYILNQYNNNYDISCSDANVILKVDYYDQSISATDIAYDIKQLQDVVIDNRDKCGLIENYGSYLFFDKCISDRETACKLSYDNKYMRNGAESLKVTFNKVNVNPLLSMPMEEYIENIDNVSIAFYMDRTDWYYFTSTSPITIYLCSDKYSEPEMVNYLKVSINKSELVQGWNIVKRSINEFTKVGKPNEHAIQYVKVEVANDNNLANRSIYFNSIIFNQRMKPTVLLAFDGIYEDGLDYTYPYLTNRNLPATIFSNGRSTFTKDVLDGIVELRAKYGWDLGHYGCHPNKELLINDDNYREQYLALKETKSWLNSNLIFNPISYSAPYGNLRPITVPLLKDLGYKIAKSDSNGYCNFFDPKYDFSIPMMLISNETNKNDIINKLDYAIRNGCCICLYTNDVTQYGDELNAKKLVFEEIIKFITDNKNEITAMTFSEFVDKCLS